MVLTKEGKTKQIEELIDKLGRAKSVVFTDYRGLKVNQLQELRNKLNEQGIDIKVVKNTLLNIALDKNKLSVDDFLSGRPLAVVFDYADEIQPCKIIDEFSKKNEALEILGGIINHDFASVKQIKNLASLPSREELYAKIVGSCAAPISGFVNVLAGNLRDLVSVLKQYQEKIN